MTLSEITQGNISIAKFMGYYTTLSESGKFLVMIDDSEKVVDKMDMEDFSIEEVEGILWPRLDVRFDRNWTELMPVLDKIEMLEEYDLSVQIEGCACSIFIYQGTFKNMLFERESSSRIAAIWKCVVAFVEWFNQFKPASI